MYDKFPPNLPHYFPADCFGGSSDLGGTDPHYFLADCFVGSSDLGGTTTKKPTQPHNCTGSDLAGTGSTVFSGRLEPKKLNTTPQLYCTPKYISSM
jgi:hypothetical protein